MSNLFEAQRLAFRGLSPVGVWANRPTPTPKNMFGKIFKNVRIITVGCACLGGAVGSVTVRAAWLQ